MAIEAQELGRSIRLQRLRNERTAILNRQPLSEKDRLAALEEWRAKLRDERREHATRQAIEELGPKGEARRQRDLEQERARKVMAEERAHRGEREALILDAMAKAFEAAGMTVRTTDATGVSKKKGRFLIQNGAHDYRVSVEELEAF